MHPAFVNTYALRTPAGLVLVDPGLGFNMHAVRDAVRAWSDAPLRVAVYTHGHVDHAFGLRAWLEHGERPEIVAQERCVARFHRYRLMHGLNGHINQRQFSLPRPVFPDTFDWPTLLVHDRLKQQLGDVELQYTAAKGGRLARLGVRDEHPQAARRGDRARRPAPGRLRRDGCRHRTGAPSASARRPTSRRSHG